MCYKERMLGKILSSLLIAASLGAATARLPVTPCILTNAPDSQACETASCANKSCCETSSQRTSLPSQSLLKSLNQDISAAPLLAVGCPLPVEIPAARRPLVSAPNFGLAPPVRVLLCTFLI
jgi:hypothetical protein